MAWLCEMCNCVLEWSNDWTMSVHLWEVDGQVMVLCAECADELERRGRKVRKLSCDEELIVARELGWI